jgi:positive regulator of sigma E activity
VENGRSAGRPRHRLIDAVETASGTVIVVTGESATIELRTPIACSRCAAGRGCGAGLLTPDRPHRINVNIPHDCRLARGDTVRLVVDARDLLRATVFAYGFPLLGLLAAVAVAPVVAPDLGDPGLALAGVAGLAGGLWFSRWRMGRSAACTRFTPVLDRAGG